MPRLSFVALANFSFPSSLNLSCTKYSVSPTEDSFFTASAFLTSEPVNKTFPSSSTKERPPGLPSSAKILLASVTPGKSAEKLIEKPSFYEINSAKGITVYCECEFHDTKEGSDFIIKNTKLIGEAIAKGICDYYGISVLDEEKTEEKKKTLYTVQVGAFSNKNNAEKYVEQLKKAGFDAIIVSK